MTRFEKIKSMNLEDLAEFLCKENDNNGNCDTCIASKQCEWKVNGMKAYLEEEFE